MDDLTFGWLLLLSGGVIVAWALPFVKDFIKEYRRIK